MKKLLAIFFCFLSLNSFATNYCVKVGGNDAANGLTDATAWATISKVNTFFSSLAAGDSILFKRGDAFAGSILVNKNGSPGSPIVIGAYGTGAKPVITGFITATGWTNIGTNKWESSPLGNTNIPNMVLINGVIAHVARWPNARYATITGHIGDVSISDATLTNAINWTGAIVHIRQLHDNLSNDTVTNHTDTTISYTNHDSYTPQNGYGYIFSHHAAALDTAYEFYYDQATTKISVYSVGSPVNVQVSVRDTLAYVKAFDYITFDNIDFEGANVSAVNFGGPGVGQASNITIKNCTINNSGNDAIYCTWDINAVIDNNTISNSLNNAIETENEGGRSINLTITNNKIKNSGMIEAMGKSYDGIVVLGENALVQYNDIDSTGHVPIVIYYDDQSIKNNLINHHNWVFGDGGAINVFNINKAAPFQYNRQIVGNIILNGGTGEGIGTLDGKPVVTSIYWDDKAHNGRVDSNLLANNPVGLYCHNCDSVTFRYNTIYKSGEFAYSVVHDGHDAFSPLRGLEFAHNNIFSTDATADTMVNITNSVTGNIDSMHVRFDSNTYARPLLITGNTRYTKKLSTANLYDFLAFKTAFNSAPFGAWDTHSVERPANANATRVEYNASKVAQTVSLGAIYADIAGTVFSGSIVLQPYASAVLTYVGALVVDPTPVGQYLLLRRTYFLSQ